MGGRAVRVQPYHGDGTRYGNTVVGEGPDGDDFGGDRLLAVFESIGPERERDRGDGAGGDLWVGWIEVSFFLCDVLALSLCAALPSCGGICVMKGNMLFFTIRALLCQLLFLCTHYAPVITSRHLYLNNNKLEGTISSSLDDLHLAEQIYLGQNSFTGTLPSNIGTNRPNEWRFFSIYDNGLTGPIPEGMKLKNAYMLDFSRNEFYGTIPNDIQQENYSTLRLLYMDHNTLTGTIPGSLMQMHKMKGIFFNDNREYSERGRE